MTAPATAVTSSASAPVTRVSDVRSPERRENGAHLIGRARGEEGRPRARGIRQALRVPGEVLLELHQREPLGQVGADEGDVATDHAGPLVARDVAAGEDPRPAERTAADPAGR